MPQTAQELTQRQDEILREMSRIRLMHRGTVSQQSYPDRAHRREGRGATGPYYVWQGSVEGKHFSKRVAGDAAQAIEEGIRQRHAFEALAGEYVALGCQLAALEGEASASEEALKRGLKSRSRSAWK